MANKGVALHGKAVEHAALEAGDYESPDQYADQGDTRVIRDLLFGYTIVQQDQGGNDVLEPRDAMRNDEVTVEQIGLIALKKGEANHSFYTTAELKALREGRSPGGGTGPLALPKAGLSELGEYELADWLEGKSEGQDKAPNVDEVLEAVGDDKELAHRMLAAENIRSDNDPRKSLEAGLHRTIGG